MMEHATVSTQYSKMDVGGERHGLAHVFRLARKSEKGTTNAYRTGARPLGPNNGGEVSIR